MFIAAMVALSFASSCKKLDDSLNLTPRDRLSGEQVWNDLGASEVFLNDIYGSLPDGYNMYDILEHWSDNSIVGYSFPFSRNVVQQATFTPFNLSLTGNTYFGTPDGFGLDWGQNYQFIRKCNVFIKNVSESETLTDDFKNTRLPEARFLRAYFYHMLWMAYGGVPLTTDPMDRSAEGDEIFKSRNTAEEIYDFITSELAEIAPGLPEEPSPGRISKGAAWTLKGWVEMFNRDYPAAAATNKQIIDELGNGVVYELFPDYGQFFTENNNREGIFYRRYIPRVKGSRNESMNAPPFTKGGVQTGWGGCDPTQELIDDYAMDDGLPIDVSPLYNPQKPYERREKRFYQSIVYDGSFWYDDTIYTRQGVNSPNEIDLSDATDATQTGYNLRKRLNPNITLGADNWDFGTGGSNYYYFRYAEVLLNYAEAQNEVTGPDQSVYDAINLIRNRSDLPDLTPGLNQEQMRDAIRRERRVELAFEDKRYWDLIRWQIAHINLNQQLHGMKITVGPGGMLQYTKVPAVGGNRVFNNPKNYLLPIPQSAIDQNPNLEQNPNY